MRETTFSLSGVRKKVAPAPGVRTFGTTVISSLFGSALIVGLYLSSLYSYLLFHTLAEMFSIIIAFGIFVIAWNSRDFLDNDYLFVVGVAYLFVGGLDLLHALAYKGSNIFTGYGANLPTQLWIAARALESVSLVIAPLAIRRNINPVALFSAYLAVFSLAVWALFYSRIFPDCYIEGVGLTPFKKISEYVICFVLLGAGALLLRYKKEFDADVLRLLLVSIVATVISELAFTFYVGVYDLSNLVGHAFKILSFYLIYVAIIRTGLVKPYSLVFRSLKMREEELEKAKGELETRVTERTRELVESNELLSRQVRERVQAEKALAEHRAQLEQTVKDRTAQLEKANLELEAAYKDMESFSYSASHDLREPLLVIDWFSRNMLKKYGEGLGEDAREMLATIHSSSVKLSQFVEDLLSFCRMNAQGVKKTEIDMRSLALGVFEDLRPMFGSRTVQVSAGSLHPAWGDAPMIRQVFVNLFSNAIKFTRPKDQCLIEIGCSEQGGEIVYFVKDNGIGFSSDMADSLFGLCRRLHPSKDFEGSGIGLVIIRKIIEKHGGRVWAEGKVDEGATFYFSLPASWQVPADSQ